MVEQRPASTTVNDLAAESSHREARQSCWILAGRATSIDHARCVPRPADVTVIALVGGLPRTVCKPRHGPGSARDLLAAWLQFGGVRHGPYGSGGPDTPGRGCLRASGPRRQ